LVAHLFGVERRGLPLIPCESPKIGSARDQHNIMQRWQQVRSFGPEDVGDPHHSVQVQVTYLFDDELAAHKETTPLPPRDDQAIATERASVEFHCMNIQPSARTDGRKRRSRVVTQNWRRSNRWRRLCVRYLSEAC
jgi:hypothetical protein